MSKNQKEFVDELKAEWKKLWCERLDDKVRVEGVAVNDQKELFIDKGTIIYAIRDSKALNFKEILEANNITMLKGILPLIRMWAVEKNL